MTPAERAELLSIPDELLAYATEQEKALYAQALDIESKLSGLLPYISFVSPQTKPYPHLRLLCTWIDALLDGCLYADGPGPAPITTGWRKETDADGKEIITPIYQHPDRDDAPVYNLAIHEPPRHGKSYVVSEHLPAYFETKFPDYSTILASYEEGFAAGWGAKARDHIVEKSEFFGVNVKGGINAAKGEWQMKSHRGAFKAAGAGGSITGRGGQLLIVDDPIKNQEDAMSAVIREGQENWWHSTFYNRRERFRLHDSTPARVIFMCTRWHEDDLRGRIIDKQRDQWAILNIPAICEPNDEEPIDPLLREPGTALCPEIMPLHELQQLRVSSKLWFEAMYQGRPFIDDGNIIKKPFQRYTIEHTEDGELVYVLHFHDGKKVRVRESNTVLYGALDLAASLKTTADWTALGLFVVTKTNPRYLLVRNMIRTRIETQDHLPWLQRQHALYKPAFILVEKATYGTNLIQAGQKVGRLPLRPVDPDKDKVMRAIGSTVVALGQKTLFFPEPGEAEWYPAYEREMLGFNNATHDDQVDVTSYGVQEFLNMPAVIFQQQEEPGWYGRAKRHREAMRKDWKKKRQVVHPDLGGGY